MVDIERRRPLDPEVIVAIQAAVTKAFEENSHRCLVGFTPEDRSNLLQLKNLMDDYPPSKLRESFRVMALLVRARNTAGNILMALFFGGLFLWALHKLFPGVFDK